VAIAALGLGIGRTEDERPPIRPGSNDRGYILWEDLGSVASFCGLFIEFCVLSELRSGVGSTLSTPDRISQSLGNANTHPFSLVSTFLSLSFYIGPGIGPSICTYLHSYALYCDMSSGKSEIQKATYQWYKNQSQSTIEAPLRDNLHPALVLLRIYGCNLNESICCRT